MYKRDNVNRQKGFYIYLDILKCIMEREHQEKMDKFIRTEEKSEKRLK